MLEGEA
jgi:hypothetical protein